MSRKLPSRLDTSVTGGGGGGDDLPTQSNVYDGRNVASGLTMA